MDLPLVTIRLAGSPRGKGRPRFARATGRAYTPAKTVRFENELRLAAQDVMGRQVPIQGPLMVVVTAAVAIPGSWSKKKQKLARDGMIFPEVAPDWDNYAKTTDALNQVVWKDDKQVVDGRVIKIYSDTPELLVEVFAKAGAQT